MENRANYFLIGVFVFGIFIASLFFIIWLGGFSQKQDFDYYQIHTKESISGLEDKSSVRLLGVEVGSVESIDIDTQQGLGVRIIIKLKKGTPITDQTYASFQLQGITGFKYIDLSLGDENATLLKSEHGTMPTIKVKQGLLSNIEKQGDKLFELLDFTNDKIKLILSDENTAHLNTLLSSLANIAQNLDTNLNSSLKNINSTLSQISSMSHEVKLAAKDFSNLSKEGAQSLKDFSAFKVPLLQNLELLELLLIQMNDLSTQMKQSPADLFFKRSQSKKAPGE